MTNLFHLIFENNTQNHAFLDYSKIKSEYETLISNVEKEFGFMDLEDYLQQEKNDWEQEKERTERYNRQFPDSYQLKIYSLKKRLNYATQTYNEVTSGEFRKKFQFEYVFKHKISTAEKITNYINSIIPKMPTWHGSKVIVEPNINLKPQTYSSSKNDAYSEFSSVFPNDFYEEKPEHEGGSANVYVGNKYAYFMVSTDDYKKYNLDDLMETIGTEEHEEFFSTDEESQDYYNLAKYIKNPRSLEHSTIVTVWTARPQRDRSVFENAHEVPKGIFVTTKQSSAMGIAQDFGSGDKENVERDVYRIRIEDKYLLTTNDAMGETWYQVVGNTDKIPVKSITLW